MDKDPALLKKYDEIIKNQLEEGIVENANSKPSVGEVTYSPHRAVIRGERATSKVRIVYDLSAKYQGPSLNKCLHDLDLDNNKHIELYLVIPHVYSSVE